MEKFHIQKKNYFKKYKNCNFLIKSIFIYFFYCFIINQTFQKKKLRKRKSDGFKAIARKAASKRKFIDAGGEDNFELSRKTLDFLRIIEKENLSTYKNKY